MPNSLLQGAAYFTAVHTRLEKASKAAVTKSARLVRDEAKRVLGTYEYGWPSLADETIAKKKTGDSPGLETGKMRRSIKFSVSGSRMNWTANVGSNEKRMLFFELGTAKQPPRSVLAAAAMRKMHEVHEICGRKMLQLSFSSHAPIDEIEDEWSYDGED